MRQPGKRHGADDVFADSQGPLVKRRAISNDSVAGPACHSPDERPSGGLGVADETALQDDFSLFFADDDDDDDVDFSMDQSFYDDALAAMSANGPMQPPPSSVVRAFDCASRSADEFDPDLMYSPPKSSSNVTADGTCEPPDLPQTQEPDWDGIPRGFSMSGPGVSGTGEAGPSALAPAWDSHGAALLTPAASTPTRDAQLSALVQQVPPSKPYKTFFHLMEMVQGKLDMYKNQPLAVFDWYARVLYSSRENFYRKQYFQFRDLFKETPPYLSGALLN